MDGGTVSHRLLDIYRAEARKTPMRATRQSELPRLVVKWGRIRHNEPDMVFCWGEGCHKADGALLDYYLFIATPGNGKTLAEELHERGYDLRTLRFSIEKRKP